MTACSAGTLRHIGASGAPGPATGPQIRRHPAFVDESAGPTTRLDGRKTQPEAAAERRKIHLDDARSIGNQVASMSKPAGSSVASGAGSGAVGRRRPSARPAWSPAPGPARAAGDGAGTGALGAACTPGGSGVTGRRAPVTPGVSPAVPSEMPAAAPAGAPLLLGVPFRPRNPPIPPPANSSPRIVLPISRLGCRSRSSRSSCSSLSDCRSAICRRSSSSSGPISRFSCACAPGGHRSQLAQPVGHPTHRGGNTFGPQDEDADEHDDGDLTPGEAEHGQPASLVRVGTQDIDAPGRVNNRLRNVGPHGSMAAQLGRLAQGRAIRRRASP